MDGSTCLTFYVFARAVNFRPKQSPTLLGIASFARNDIT